MKGTKRKKTINKYAIRRRIALFSILVCILGIFLVTNKEQSGITRIAGKGKEYAAKQMEELMTTEDNGAAEIIMEYNMKGNCIDKCKVIVESRAMLSTEIREEFSSKGWDIVNEVTVEKIFKSNQTVREDFGVFSIDLNVDRIGNHIITLSSEELFDAVLESISGKYNDLFNKIYVDEQAYQIEITEADLQRITSLDISGKNITDVTGIEHFTALENLNVGNDFMYKENLDGGFAELQYNYTVINGINTKCLIKAETTIGSGATPAALGQIFRTLNPELSSTGIEFTENDQIIVKVPTNPNNSDEYSEYETKVRYIPINYDVSENGDGSIRAYLIPRRDENEQYDLLITGSGTMKNFIVDGTGNHLPYATYCEKIVTVEIDGTISNIGRDAFNGCTNLSVIKLPDGLVEIGSGAFQNCTALQSIELPDTVKKIGTTAFVGCNRLRYINIPEGLELIGYRAFHGCTSLKEIKIPNTVEEIQSNAFDGWNEEQTIYCGFAEQPEGWANAWDENCNAKIVWLKPTQSVELLEYPIRKVFEVGEVFDIEGLKIKVTYSDRTEILTVKPGENGEADYVEIDNAGTKTTTTIEESKIQVAGTPTQTAGVKDVTLLLDGKEIGVYKVAVGTSNDFELQLEHENVKKMYTYETDDVLDLTGLEVYRVYKTDRTIKEKVTAYEATPANGTKLTALGNNTVTIKYGENQSELIVKLKDVLESIEVQAPNKRDYIKGEDEYLNLAGLKITANYNSGRSVSATVSANGSVGYDEGFIDTDEGMAPGESGLAQAGIVVEKADLQQLGAQNVKVKYKGKEATFEIIVRELSRIEIDTDDVKKEYNYGETLNLNGLVVNGIYTAPGVSDKTVQITEGYVATPDKLNPEGKTPGINPLTQKVTVIYGGKTAEFEVEVANKVDKIELNSVPAKKNYIKGEELDLTGGKVTITYQDGTQIGPIDIDSDKVTVEGYDPNKTGNQTVIVKYDGEAGTTKGQFTVNVSNTISKIEIVEGSLMQTTYKEGESLNLSRGKITVTYSNGATKEIAITSDMVSGYNPNQLGEQNVKVRYEGKETTFKVTVNRNNSNPTDVESLDISGNFKKDYVVGEKINPAGMVITAKFIDGTTAQIEVLEDGKCKVTKGDETREYDSYEAAGVTIYVTEFTSVGKQEILVSYRSKTGKFEVNVAEKQQGGDSGDSGEEPGGEDPEKPGEDVKVEISGAELKEGPTKTEYTEGDKLDLSGMKLEVSYSDGSKETIEFKENGKVVITKDGNTTEYGSAEEAGITVVPNGELTVGEHEIKVTYKEKEIGLPVTIKVNKKIIEVTGIELDKTAETIEVGETAVFVATIKPEDATDKNVTWTSSDEETAIVSESGVVLGLKEGTVTITVTSDANPNVKAEAQVTVVPEPPKVPVTGVTLNKAETTLNVGEMESLVATVKPENATNKNVTWTSSDEEKVIVDENGTILVLAEGETTITVTTVDGSYTATCVVNAEGEKQDPIVSVEGVSLDKAAVTIKVGETESLVATVAPENATNKKVTWTSSDEEVATVEGGVVTAKKAGKATIKVESEDGKKIAVCEVTVEEIKEEEKDDTVKVTGVKLNKSKTTLEIGDTEALKATITPENATNKNITWTSSDEAVVTVKGGVITAKKEGKATITVVTEDGEKTATCEVTVKKVEAPAEKEEDKKPNTNTLANTTNTTNTTNNNTTKPAGNVTNTQKPDTSPVILPATGKGMLFAVIGLITIGGAFCFIRYRNIDK